MLKWLNQYKGKSSQGTGMKYPLKGKTWVYGYELSANEQKKLAKDFRVSLKRLQNFERTKRSHIYSRWPLTFMLVDYYAHSREIERENILYHLEDNAALIVLEKPLKLYDDYFKRVSTELKESRLDLISVLCNALFCINMSVWTADFFLQRITNISTHLRYLSLSFMRI